MAYLMYRIISLLERPKKEQFDKEKYMDDFGKKVMELDVVKGELVRDIIDYKELRDLSNDDVDNLQSMIRNKLDEIEDSIQSIIDTGDQVIQDRQDAFQSDMSPEEIRSLVRNTNYLKMLSIKC